MKPSSAGWQRSAWLGFMLACVLSTACSAAEPEGSDPAPLMEASVSDSAGIRVHEFAPGVLGHSAQLRLADDPAVRIGLVEGAPEYQWTRPAAAARLSDGGFVVLEQRPAELRIFDRSGTFVRRVGRAGEGPGEFQTPTDLAVLEGDTLVVWDSRAQRLSWFSSDGDLVRERTLREPGGIRTLRRVALLPGAGAIVLGATTTVEDLANRGRVREVWQVLALMPDDEAGGSLGTIPGTERTIQVEWSGPGQGEIVSINIGGRWWWGEGFVWPSERGAWTADRLGLEARHFDRERGLDRIVRIRGPGQPFTASLIDSLHAVELDRVDDPEVRELWRADFELREYPESVPPVEAIFADRAGRVWIGLTEAPPARLPSGAFPAVRQWAVFEEHEAGDEGGVVDLRAMGVITLPSWSHPLWADAEGVLLVRNEPDLGVDFVEWYPYGEG